MLHQASRLAGSRHGVPLVAHPSGVHDQRISRSGLAGRQRRGDGDQPCFTVRVKKVLSVNSRGVPCGRAALTGHWIGCRVSHSSLDNCASPLMSNARVPAFSKPDKAACSRKISAGCCQAKASANPSRCATWLRIHQSGLASPVQPETRVAGRYSVPNWSPCHFSPPAQGGQQDMRGAGGVRVTQNVGHNNQRTARQTGPHAIGIRK